MVVAGKITSFSWLIVSHTTNRVRAWKQICQMIRSLTLIALITASFSAFGQSVTKRILVEHFTNTYCSICATRNPGFYANLDAFPDVIHISYYPSAPYPACPLNQQNVTENDARTNYYGVYGSTPRLVIQGNVIPASQSYNNPSLLQLQEGQLTPIDLAFSLVEVPGNELVVRASVTIKDTVAGNGFVLFASVVEDTLLFPANNGEQIHRDVFRKSVWGNPLSVNMPSGIGDSLILTMNIPISAGWNKSQLRIIGAIQDADKMVVQAAESARLVQTTGVSPLVDSSFTVYPNPVKDVLHIAGHYDQLQFQVVSQYGQILLTGNAVRTIYVHNLPPGLYVLNLVGADGSRQSSQFIKQ